MKPKLLKLPQISPGPHGECWLCNDTPGKNNMTHCTKKLGHEGPCSWGKNK